MENNLRGKHFISSIPKDIILEAHLESKTRTEMGNKLNVSRGTIQRYIKKYNLEIPDQREGQKMFLTKTPKLEQMASDSGSMLEFAQKIGVSWHTAKKYALILGLDIKSGYKEGRYRRREQKFVDRDEEIISLRTDGKTLAFISETFGISRGRVFQICKRYKNRENLERLGFEDIH